MEQIYVDRLMKVVQSLLESKRPRKFDMGMYVHTHENFCGTPGCALGHYAARRDLQKVFKVFVNKDGLRAAGNDYEDGAYGFLKGPDDRRVHHDSLIVQEHFGLTRYEATELFASDGCDNAKTTRAAAKYIKDFIEFKRINEERAAARMARRR